MVRIGDCDIEETCRRAHHCLPLAVGFRSASQRKANPRRHRLMWTEAYIHTSTPISNTAGDFATRRKAWHDIENLFSRASPSKDLSAVAHLVNTFCIEIANSLRLTLTKHFRYSIPHPQNAYLWHFIFVLEYRSLLILYGCGFTYLRIQIRNQVQWHAVGVAVSHHLLYLTFRCSTKNIKNRYIML